MTKRLRDILMGSNIKPVTSDEKAVKYAVDNAGGGGGSDLPDVTAADNGKLLGVDGGEWGKVDPPSELPAVTASDNGKVLGVADGAWGAVTPASFAPYAVTGTLGESGGKETITLNNTKNNLTAKDLYDAVSSGVQCAVSLSMPVPDVGTVNMVVVTSVVAAQSTLHDQVKYNFAMFSADGKQFFKEGLLGGDTVVLTEVVNE